MPDFFRASAVRAGLYTMLAGLAVCVTEEFAAAGFGSADRSLEQRLGFGPGVANHPVNVVPSAQISIPKEWPVDFKGAITCLTCHEALPSLNGTNAPNLRGSSPEDSGRLAFCANCHADTSRRGLGNMHWTVTGVAHVRSMGDGHRSAGSLDGYSRQCLGCHDGVSASDYGFTVGENLGAPGAVDLRHTHPVGVPYKRIGSKNRNARLRPAALLPREVPLPAGRVSCVSCHNLYASDRFRLTVPVENSHLCFTCHDMD